MNDKISRRNARKSGATLVDFVLVHGTWGGGWQWRPVAERLRARGHRVFTPTLTGLGERAHLVSRDTGLDTHVADIVNVIAWEDLTRVALVGTSYGGLVISGVADRMPEGIASLIYLDAALPEHGKCMLDRVPPQGRYLEVPDKAYVLASLKPTHHFAQLHAWAGSQPGWSARKIPSNHFPMTTMPDATADLLMELAGA